jgi:hypothetical protein
MYLRCVLQRLPFLVLIVDLPPWCAPAASLRSSQAVSFNNKLVSDVDMDASCCAM